MARISAWPGRLSATIFRGLATPNRSQGADPSRFHERGRCFRGDGLELIAGDSARLQPVVADPVDYRDVDVLGPRHRGRR